MSGARPREVERDGALPRIELDWPDGGPPAGIALRPLNFGRSTGAPAAEVEAAWRALRDWGGGRYHTVVGGSQVHGARLFSADGLTVPGDAEPVAARLLRVAGYDGFVSAEPGVLVTVGVADCVPALLWAPRARAVALLHAGWRGVAAEIVTRAVAALVERDGVAEEIRAWWGPAIGPCHYPVGEEVVAAIRATSAGPGTDGWVEAGPDGPRVDLRAALTRQALAAGLAPEAVTSSSACTSCDPVRFHSYRREAGGGGRMVAFAGIPLA
ncbi:MAG: polyphenol oxidase family protein [Gemmatimonadetes bacterium]|nr:polyphenol oxidase family protein [Gemmatimonadota bacterium]